MANQWIAAARRPGALERPITCWQDYRENYYVLVPLVASSPISNQVLLNTRFGLRTNVRDRAWIGPRNIVPEARSVRLPDLSHSKEFETRPGTRVEPSNTLPCHPGPGPLPPRPLCEELAFLFAIRLRKLRRGRTVGGVRGTLALRTKRNSVQFWYRTSPIARCFPSLAPGIVVPPIRNSSRPCSRPPMKYCPLAHLSELIYVNRGLSSCWFRRATSI